MEERMLGANVRNMRCPISFQQVLREKAQRFISWFIISWYL